MEHLFFNSWDALVRIIIVGVVSYAALILLLRAAGKRTLSRMNVYDILDGKQPANLQLDDLLKQAHAHMKWADQRQFKKGLQRKKS